MSDSRWDPPAPMSDGTAEKIKNVFLPGKTVALTTTETEKRVSVAGTTFAAETWEAAFALATTAQVG